MTENTVIAHTILNQLGYARLKAMTGAYFLKEEERGVSFRFRGSKKVNYLKIVLNGLDLYNLEFGKVSKSSYNVVNTTKDVYFDQLIPIFEEVTGLAARL